MRTNSSKLYSFFLIIADFVALVVAFVVAYLIRVRYDDRALLVDSVEGETFLHVFVLLLPFWLIIFAFINLYSADVYSKRLSELGRLLVGSFIGILFVIGADFVTDEPLFPARLIAVYALVGSFLLLALERNVMWLMRKSMFRFGIGTRRVLLIGSNESTTKLATLLSNTATSGYDIRGIVASKSFVPKKFKGNHYISLDKALASISKMRIDTIIQTEMLDSSARNKRILDTAFENHLAYKFIPANSEYFTGKNQVEIFEGYPIISVHQTALIGWGRIAKRLADFAGSIIGLIIASPVLLLIAFIIKLTDFKGPVFFKHQRMTRYGEPFYVYKFRSMYWKYSTGAKASGKSDLQIFKEMGREDLIEEFKKNQKVEKDPRITPIGRFLRATSLDELPQLFNVLKGELSLVGPRPIVKDELRHYKEYGGGSLVLSVKSGVTGLWQVSGRSDLSYEERVKLDMYYVQNWSFWLDIKIMLRTVVAVIKKSGAR